MRSLFLSICAFALSMRALAQCTVPIPATVLPMQHDSVLSVVGQALWVCPGVTVDGSSIDPVFFLESGATMVFSGISKNIYAKSGSVVDGSGIDDTIYYEPGASILLSGSPVLFLCNPLAFDYTQAPNGGCTFPTALPDGTIDAPGVRPVVGGIQLAAPDLQGRSVRLLDGSGRIVRSLVAGSDRITLPMDACAPGIHVIAIDGPLGVRTVRFAWASAN